MSNTEPEVFTVTCARQYLEEFLGRPVEKDIPMELEDEWYRTGEQDFSLYGGDPYLQYLLKAHDYSRKCVDTALRFMKEYMEPAWEPKRWMDCGTGLGFFAATIAQEYPDCEVVATNLPSRQWEFNEWLFERLDLPNLTLSQDPQGKFDTVMMMEGFEHYQEPDAELYRLLEAHDPDLLIESSSFSRRGLGHFSEYRIGGITYVEREHQQEGKKGAGPAFRQFTKVVKAAGFERVPIEMRGWSHSRPRIWKKVPIEPTPIEQFFGA